MPFEINKKFGFNIYQKPPEDFFQYASEFKLKQIEINLSQDKKPLDLFDEKRIKTINELSEKYKIKVSLHLPFNINISEIIRPFRNSDIKFFNDCIILAEKLSATHITAHIGNFYWFPVEKWMRTKALHRFLKYFREILLNCEKHNVYIALENVVPIPHGTEYYLLGDNIEDFKYIFENIESKYLKFCLDTGHANMGEGVIEYVNHFHEKLICIHYHDNRGKDDEHLPIGDGTVPWQELAEELQIVNFNGPIISECRNIKAHEAAEKFSNYFENTSTTNFKE